MTEGQVERIIKLLEGINFKLEILANAAPRQPEQIAKTFQILPPARSPWPGNDIAHTKNPARRVLGGVKG